MSSTTSVWLLAGLVALLTPTAGSAQILETETARPVGRGVFKFGGNFEYQRSNEGHESALPLLIEYGFSSRLELALEPVGFTKIRPKVGTRASGAGDLEATLTFLASHETGAMPAIAFAGEIKFPTAKNRLIGTGRTDYALYVIGSKKLGDVDLHGNLGYTIVGKPLGAPLKNILNVAVGGERKFKTAWSIFGEVLANTASSTLPEAANQATPEAPGGEIVGSLGLARYVSHSFRLSMGVSVDNNGAVLVRPGITLWRR